MPRCPDCNRFVSLEQGEPEVQDLDIDEDGQITATVRIVNLCAECGTELTEATLEFYGVLLEDVSSHQGEGHTLEIDEDHCQATMSTQGKGRGLKTFYGAELHYRAKCSCGKLQETTDSLSVDVQASDMDNLG